MDIRAGNYCCSMDQESVIYIEDQYSEGSLSSSLVIPTTRQLTESFAEVSKLQVLFQRVVATIYTAFSNDSISEILDISSPFKIINEFLFFFAVLNNSSLLILDKFLLDDNIDS